MRRVWMVLALAGCRQVFGIDEPLATGVGTDHLDAAKHDGHAISFDATAMSPGLAMHVADGKTLWTNDQPPDTAWQVTTGQMSHADVWMGEDVTLGQLVFDGDLGGQSPFSVWMEGQVLLPSTTEQLQITAADYAFIDVEQVPFTGEYQEIVSSRGGMMQMRTFDPPLPGWYGIRIGWSATPQSGAFDVLHSDGNSPQVAMFTSTNLRH